MTDITKSEGRYIGLMRGLDEFSRDVFDVEVLDWDFAPELDSISPRQHSIRGFKRELSRLYYDIDESERGTELMRRRISSTISYIGAIANHSITGSLTSEGQSFTDYIIDTMGVKPEVTPEDSLLEQRKDIDKALSEMGYSYDPSDRERFHQDICIKDMGSAVGEIVESAKSDLVNAAGAAALEGIGEPDIRVVNDKDTWAGYFGTDEDGEFYINVNSNPLLRISPAEARITLAHELGHWLSASTKRKMIAERELSPAAGLLPFASQTYFQEETVARAVEEHVLSKQNDPLARYIKAELPYKNAVAVNMIIDSNSGKSEEEVAKYGLEHLPYEDPEKINAEAKLFRNNVVFATVFAVDGEALRLGRQIAEQPNEQRQATIGRLSANAFSTGELAGAIRLGV